MKTQCLRTFLGKTLFSVLTLTLCFGFTMMSHGSAVVSLQPTPSEIPEVGKPITLQVNITGGEVSVAGYQFTVAFDPSALRYIAANNADYLRSDTFAMPLPEWDVDVSYNPIDTSGELPDGTKFDDLNQFLAALASHPERFVTNLTERLMTYALGRGLEYYDMPAVRMITREAALHDHRLSSVVVGIVKSAPFQMRRSQAPVSSPLEVASARR